MNFFNKHSLEKLNLYLSIFGKVVAKNTGLGNNIIFLQEFFFTFLGRGTFPVFPLAAPMYIPKSLVYILCDHSDYFNALGFADYFSNDIKLFPEFL